MCELCNKSFVNLKKHKERKTPCNNKINTPNSTFENSKEKK